MLLRGRREECYRRGGGRSVTEGEEGGVLPKGRKEEGYIGNPMEMLTSRDVLKYSMLTLPTVHVLCTNTIYLSVHAHHTHTNTYIHKLKHIHPQAHKHKHIRTHTNPHKHTHKPTNTHMHTHMQIKTTQVTHIYTYLPSSLKMVTMAL